MIKAVKINDEEWVKITNGIVFYGDNGAGKTAIGSKLCDNYYGGDRKFNLSCENISKVEVFGKDFKRAIFGEEYGKDQKDNLRRWIDISVVKLLNDKIKVIQDKKLEIKRNIGKLEIYKDYDEAVSDYESLKHYESVEKMDEEISSLEKEQSSLSVIEEKSNDIRDIYNKLTSSMVHKSVFENNMDNLKSILSASFILLNDDNIKSKIEQKINNIVIKKEKIDALVKEINDIKVSLLPPLEDYFCELVGEDVTDKIIVLKDEIYNLKSDKGRVKERWRLKDFIAHNDTISNFEKEIKELEKQIDEASSEHLNAFTKKTIEIFNYLGDGRTKMDIVQDKRGNTISYNIKITKDGKYIKPANYQSQLSESAIDIYCFSIFMTKNIFKEDIKDYILIFDDATNSFDDTTIVKFRKLMQNIKKKCSQIIIMTHSKEIYNNFIEDGFSSLCIKFGDNLSLKTKG